MQIAVDCHETDTDNARTIAGAPRTGQTFYLRIKPDRRQRIVRNLPHEDRRGGGASETQQANDTSEKRTA